MSRVEELLEPISEESPAGEDLYYSPLKRELEELRREEDEGLSQGVWRREIKKADHKQVIKLASKALKEKGKDLFIAAFLVEAWAREEGLPGMLDGFDLLLGLMDKFWDTLYPEIEDGDPEFRATPLGWVGTNLEPAVRLIPLTATGIDWYDYQDSVRIPTEDEAQGDEVKTRRRKEADEEGKTMPEDVDDGLKATQSTYLEGLFEHTQQAREKLDELNDYCNDKFEDVAPSFKALSDALEELETAVKILQQRREKLLPKAEPAEGAAEAPQAGAAPAPEPSPPPAASGDSPFSDSPFSDDPFAASPQPEPQPEEAAPEPEPQPESPAEEPEPAPAADPFAASDPFAAPAQPPAAQPPAAEPAAGSGVSVSGGDPADYITSGAQALRRADPENPAAYLAVRGLRWGELRRGGSRIDDALLAAPATTVRVELKRLHREKAWEELLDASEQAAASPAGRAWMDAQRYGVEACEGLGRGYKSVVKAILATLRALLADYPELPYKSLEDDTPAATPETIRWLEEQGLTAPSGEAEARSTSTDGLPPAEVDAWELAQQAAEAGRPEQGLAILRSRATQENSARERYFRKIQMARICLDSDNVAIALPILEEAVQEIQSHNLEDWEAPETTAEPLELLHRCLSRLDADAHAGRLREIYEQLCRLDPVRALSLPR